MSTSPNCSGRCARSSAGPCIRPEASGCSAAAHRLKQERLAASGGRDFVDAAHPVVPRRRIERSPLGVHRDVGKQCQEVVTCAVGELGQKSSHGIECFALVQLVHSMSMAHCRYSSQAVVRPKVDPVERAGPDRSKAIYDEISRLGHSERWEEAESVIQRSLAENPDDPESPSLMVAGAGIRHAEGDDAAASDLIRRALSLASGDPAVLTRASRLLFNMGREREAARCVRTAAPLVVEHTGSGQGFPFDEDLVAMIGRVAWFEGNDEAAESAYRFGFETWPTNDEFGGLLVGFLVRRDRRDEARDVADRALRSRPDDEKLAAYCSALLEDQ
jgi:tetratricopeptide (TPR) repeat protein